MQKGACYNWLTSMQHLSRRNDFVNLYRLEKSKILLKNEDLSITEVALECGFNSGSYYAELFKKYNGCTPRNFRKYKK